MKSYCTKLMCVLLAITINLSTVIVYADNNISSLQGASHPGLQIEDQELTISLEQITNSVTVLNDTQEDILQTFMLPVAMNIKVDNQNHNLQHYAQAISTSGKDISKLLKSLGVPYDPITALHTIDASPNRDSIRNKLIEFKLLDKGEETPNWSMKSVFLWHTKFAAHSKTTVTLSYTPTVIDRSMKIKNADGLIKTPIKVIKKIYSVAVDWTLEDKITAKQLQQMLEDGNPQLTEFCPKINDYQAILNSDAEAANTTSIVETKTVSYPYLVNELQCTPVKKFTLKIEVPKNMHAILCWDNDFKIINKTTLIFEQTNFAAQQNIKILYVVKLSNAS